MQHPRPRKAVVCVWGGGLACLLLLQAMHLVDGCVQRLLPIPPLRALQQ